MCCLLSIQWYAISGFNDRRCWCITEHCLKSLIVNYLTLALCALCSTLPADALLNIALLFSKLICEIVSASE